MSVSLEVSNCNDLNGAQNTETNTHNIQVNLHLSQFRAENVEDFDRIRTVLKFVLDPKIEPPNAGFIQWIEADQWVKKFDILVLKSEELGQDTMRFLQTRIAEKIKEIEILSPRAKAKLVIENNFSYRIDECLNLPLKKSTDIDLIKELLNGLLSEYDERIVPDSYEEAYRTLKCFLENQSPVLKYRGLSAYRDTLFMNSQDAALLKILVTKKIAEKLDQIDTDFQKKVQSEDEGKKIELSLDDL